MEIRIPIKLAHKMSKLAKKENIYFRMLETERFHENNKNKLVSCEITRKGLKLLTI